MTSILENELVRKYFRPEECKDIDTVDHDWLSCLAYSVIEAMQAPIRKGERLLVIGTDSVIYDAVAIKDLYDIHPFDLRLPDRFQKRECIVCDGTVGKDAHLCDEHGRIWLGCKPAPEPCEHTDVWFDRTIYKCSPKCDECMHTVCNVCSKPDCQWDVNE